MSEDYKVLTITYPDVENGLGCRVTIWCSGCSHHCPGCHNAHTWIYGRGKNLSDKTIREQIFTAVNRPYIAGITLSGGDPLDQSFSALQQLEIFIDDFKKEFPDKNIWVYSGDTFEELIISPIKKRILKKCDVLVDGRFIKEQYDPDLAFRGSSNQRIINLKEKFKELD